VNRWPTSPGVREFWSLELAVNPSVLIPRPETECLVEAVLPFLDDPPPGSPKRVLEMGAGSGAIVIALAHEHPEHRYMAMDRSAAALQTARQNARTHQVDDRIAGFAATGMRPWRRPGDFDLIVSNPPYIRSGDMNGLQPEIRNHEPEMALDGSGDGLACLRQIIDSAHRYLRPGGLVALEMGYDQKADIQAIAAAVGQYVPRKF
jgi:release factor glutamine methyltransferase